VAQLASAQLERRRAPRRRSQLAARCCIHNATEEGAWRATLRACYARTVRMATDRPFRPGLLLSVPLPRGGHGRPRLRFLRVVRLRAQPEQAWLVEGTADRELGADELDAWRRAPRRLAHAIEEGPWWASIRDVSATGLSLIARRPFKPGTLLSVQLPGQTSGPPTLLRLVRARRQQQSAWWVLGCAFLIRLPPGRLATLI
jgi:hypothetical protein